MIVDQENVDLRLEEDTLEEIHRVDTRSDRSDSS